MQERIMDLERDEMDVPYRRRKKRKRILVEVIVVLVAVIIVVFKIRSMLIPDDPTLTTVSKASLEKIIEINDMSTLDYTYNAIAEVYKEDGETLKYYVAYEGVVTAGIDIQKIDLKVDEKKKTITLTLPEAEIQNVDIDMGTMEFIFEKDKYETEKVTQEAYKASLEDLQKKAKMEDHLLSMARENALMSMRGLIAPWAEQLAYTVEVI